MAGSLIDETYVLKATYLVAGKKPSLAFFEGGAAAVDCIGYVLGGATVSIITGTLTAVVIETVSGER
ncbi:hypothetical protein [Brevibacillus sp. 179-C9.3 HS]|uniref:hypothetical protein n=1 Tax=unclassified Brevibacillus TaxID=2684853 RepID=UPI0039A1467D